MRKYDPTLSLTLKVAKSNEHSTGLNKKQIV
jgi:hypothetical protein